MMRSSFARRLAQIVLLPAALFGSVAVASPAQAALTTTQMEAGIVHFINQERGKAGCSKLRTDGKLVRAARAHSAYMARTRKFSHVGAGGSSFVTRVQSAGYKSAMSENIAWGYRSGSTVVAALMKSPGHRANIVNCRAKAQGVGVVYTANGTPYITQDFGSK